MKGTTGPLTEFSHLKDSAIIQEVSVLRFDFCEETSEDRNYRKLVCHQGLKEGTLLLTETPILCTPTSHCSCQSLAADFEEVGGPLLVEHITMALALTARERRTDLNSTTVSDAIIHNLCSGITSIADLNQRCWSQRLQLVMMAISCISTIFFAQADGSIGQTDDSPKSPLYKDFCHRSKRFFSILTRLPANTHAVSRVVSSNSSSASDMRTIQQIRVGYAVFLRASCVNHSCSPNASFRFRFDGSQASKEDSEPSAKELLRRVRLELVSTRPVRFGEEVCVTYGPLRGAMSVEKRRSVLRAQYLFSCHCQSCREDAAASEAAKSAASLTNLKIDNTLLQQRFQLLESLQCDLAVLSDDFSDFINDCPSFLESKKAISSLEARALVLARRSSDIVKDLFPDGRCIGKTGDESHREGDDLLHWARDKEADDPLLRASRPLLDSPQTMLSAPALSASLRQLWTDCSSAVCLLLDLQAQISARSGQAMRAALLVTASIRTLQGVFGRLCEDPVALGREYLKLAQLLLSCGLWQTAEEASVRSTRLLAPFLDCNADSGSECDPDWADLNEMRELFRRMKETKS